MSHLATPTQVPDSRFFQQRPSLESVYELYFKKLGQRLVADAMIVYAQAEQTIRNPLSSQEAVSTAHDTQLEVKSFFDEAPNDDLLLLSGLDIELIVSTFRSLVCDDDRLSKIAKMKFAG